jgi:ArsR family transcriptional regulator, arsenate/arsenite/antimonite-responsive transcriptional repressor
MNTKIDDKKVEKISKALGDPYRIKIMKAIKEENDWLQCQAIKEMFNLAQSTVSHHISQLVDADLLHAEKDGRHARYKINKEVFGAYVSYLKDFSSK